MTYVLGIDIGGSGIKGAPVDLVTGDFAAERVRILGRVLSIVRHARPAAQVSMAI